MLFIDLNQAGISPVREFQAAAWRHSFGITPSHSDLQATEYSGETPTR